MIAVFAVFVPAACAIAALLARRTAAGTTILGAVIVVVAGLIGLSTTSVNTAVDVPWIPVLGARFALGGDAISWSLVAVSGAITAAAISASTIARTSRTFNALFSTMLCGLCIAFLARDLLLFYFGFEIALVPMYFIIGIWGSPERRGKAALTFFLYTRLGSLAMLLGIIGLDVASTHGFAMGPYASLGPISAALVFAGLLFGFAIKFPVVPLHLWLPLAHVEAPTEGSVVLAALLLKLGGYGLLRIALPALGQTFAAVAPWVAAWGVISALWSVLAAFPQNDLKRLIAYSSVNHMAYVLIGISVAAVAGPQTQIGMLAISGASLQMVSHALLTAGLFILVGWIHDRYGTREISKLGGIVNNHPGPGWIFILLALGSVGIPGLSGFAAEVQIIIATVAVYPAAAIGMVIAIVLSTALFVWTIARVAFGKAQTLEQSERPFPKIALYALVSLSALLGIVPRLLVDGYVVAAKALRF